jgi:3-oxoacyl-[acyl-carrier protein] reductase
MDKKVILITGGTDGLGKAIAERLAKSDNVIICSPSEERVRGISKLIGCEGIVCDAGNAESVAACVARVVKKYGRIDVLINNAGVWIQGPLTENDPERISDVVAVNLIGPMLMSRTVIPAMRNSGKGLIINVISQAGLYGKAERTVYNATKFGLTGFTKSLAMELAPVGIRVTGLYPGMMRTAMFSKLGIEKDMGRAVDPSTVAGAIAFLLSLPDDVAVPEFGIKHVLN